MTGCEAGSVAGALTEDAGRAGLVIGTVELAVPAGIADGIRAAAAGAALGIFDPARSLGVVLTELLGPPIVGDPVSPVPVAGTCCAVMAVAGRPASLPAGEVC